MVAPSELNILVVDNDADTRESLQVWLEQQAGIRVVGTAANGVAAIQSVMEYQPDIVLLDMQLPLLDGIKTAGVLKEKWFNCRIIIITCNYTRSKVFAAFGAGADGYLNKFSMFDHLNEAIRSVAANSVWLDPMISKEVFSAREKSVGKANTLFKSGLASTERRILRLLGSGYSSEQTGKILLLSPEDTQAYLRNIIDKLTLNCMD